MHHGVCCHSDKFQECVRMASVIWASLLQVCRKIDESLPLMSLSRQYIFLYLFLHYPPLSVDFFTRPPPPPSVLLLSQLPWFIESVYDQFLPLSHLYLLWFPYFGNLIRKKANLEICVLISRGKEKMKPGCGLELSITI